MRYSVQITTRQFQINTHHVNKGPFHRGSSKITRGFAGVSGRDESGQVDHAARADDEVRRGRVDGQRVGTLWVRVDLVPHGYLNERYEKNTAGA